METTWALVTEHGLLSMTMSQIAERSGIGRATLYKYFPDIESILGAWHVRHVDAHLAQLAELQGHGGDPGDRLAAVLGAYGLVCYHRERHGGPEVGALLHRGEEVSSAQRRLHALFRDLLAESTSAGAVRADVPSEELATYCLHALAAAGSLPSEEAVHRLVGVTLASLRPDMVR